MRFAWQCLTILITTLLVAGCGGAGGGGGGNNPGGLGSLDSLDETPVITQLSIAGSSIVELNFAGAKPTGNFMYTDIPGDLVSYLLYTEDTKGRLKTDGILQPVDLKDQNSEKGTGTFIIPINTSKPGKYRFGIRLVDAMGNKSKIKTRTIEVCDTKRSTETFQGDFNCINS